MKKIFLLISALIGFITFGQEIQLDRIDEIVKSIEKDSTLKQTEYNLTILAGITTGSDWNRIIWKNKKIVRKIVEEIKYLEYVSHITIYLENGIPIKIIEKEENFETTQDGHYYSIPIEVFSATIYIYDWENDQSKIIKNGKRVFTEGSCSNFDYESLIEID